MISKPSLFLSLVFVAIACRIAAASIRSRDRTLSTVVPLYRCRIGTNTAGVGASVSVWYFASSTTPMTSVGAPPAPKRNLRPIASGAAARAVPA